MYLHPNLRRFQKLIKKKNKVIKKSRSKIGATFTILKCAEKY